MYETNFFYYGIIFYLNKCQANNEMYLGGELAASVPTTSFPIKSEPSNIYGYRAAFQVYNHKMAWNKTSLFLDLSYTYLSSSQNNISISALAPILRYSFYKSKMFRPFIDLSIGPAYMTKTMFGNRNLGISYTFQDIVGLGLKFGKHDNIMLSWRIIHFSNGGLSSHNSGITVPIIFSVNYIPGS